MPKSTKQLKSFAPRISEVEGLLEELQESEEPRYAEFDYVALEQLTDRALLVKFRLEHFDDQGVWKRTAGKTWIPLGQMRQFEGTLYFSHWICEKKGLKVK